MSIKKLLIALLFAGMVFDNAKAADERYSVEISVDVTDVSASAAQQRAMSEANRAAIGAVAKRITNQEGVAKLSVMTDEQLVNFIKEVSVKDEKRSSVRYMANLRVVLNEDILKEYMKERDIPVMRQINSKILVVPIFREFSSDAPMLWESSNIWKQAWDEKESTSVINLIPIAANGANYAVIDGRKALMTDGEALNKLMLINNVDDVYVLDAMYDGIEGLIIKAVSFGGDNRTIRVTGARSSGIELFNKAVDAVSQEIENRISQKTIDEASIENMIVVLYEYSNLADWVATEKELQNINQVNKIEVQAQGVGKVQFKMAYIGSLEKLLQQLRGRSFRLVEHNGYYSIEKY